MPAKPPFTEKQGQYLAFIHLYTKINGQPPAETDIARYFQVTPPSVHRMIVELDRKGLIERKTGVGRSITVQVSPDDLPPLQ